MQRTASRATPGGGQWRMATIPATGDPEAGTPQLEFMVVNGAPAGTSGNGKDVDQPTQAGSYRLRCPGGYKLQRGRLHPFPRARAAASMLVPLLLSTPPSADLVRTPLSTAACLLAGHWSCNRVVGSDRGGPAGLSGVCVRQPHVLYHPGRRGGRCARESMLGPTSAIGRGTQQDGLAHSLCSLHLPLHMSCSQHCTLSLTRFSISICNVTKACGENASTGM